LGLGAGGGGLVLLQSVHYFNLTLYELSIVSDFVECVRLHNLPVVKDCVQQVLEGRSKTRGGGREEAGIQNER